jgi:outer membrane protein OmpA-like peptidoglycan-associated protein
MSRYFIELKKLTLRNLISCLFISMCFLGAEAQSEADSTKAKKAAIKHLSLGHFSLGQNDLAINDIEVDRNNRVIVATSKMLLVISNPKDDPEQFLDSTYLTCAIAGKDNKLYAAGNNHLYIVGEGRKVSIDDAEVKIVDIAYNNGRLYLATNKGLYAYTLSSGNWKNYTSQNSKLKSNVINFVMLDDNKVIWVGTEKGYLKIDGDDWGLEDKKYNVLKSRSNKEGQWMVAQGDMFLIDPFNRKYDVGLNEELYKGVINDFVIDSKGRLYMASETLIRYNPYNEEIEKYGEDMKLLSQKCISLACDKNNNIWIGTESAGLFMITFDDIAQEQLSAAILVTKNVSCNDGKDAKLKVSVAGGAKPYNYKWSAPGMKGSTPHRVEPGSYAVTVTDRYGSLYVSEVTLSNPKAITIELGEVSRVTGFNKKDGTAEIIAAGGSGNLTYTWSNGSKGAKLLKASPGKYTVTVADERSCKEQLQVEVKKEKYIPELDITKVNIGQALRINELIFDADSTNLRSENFEILDEVYDFLVKYPTVKIEIGGHTNTIPPHVYCDKLSKERAKSVAEYVIYRGIDTARVEYKGYGKREPLTESKSTSARKKNQRVEVKILSL